MRIEGILSKWNDDRGFGFITPTQGGAEFFVHISAFPRDGRRPIIGEQVTFEVETDSTGKKRAYNVFCPDRPNSHLGRRPIHRRSAYSGFFARIIPFFVIAALAFYGYNKYLHREAPQTEVVSQSNEEVTSVAFRCDGRTHCSQMTSCFEAKFFLRNCPNTQMDGDHDGVPCEQQWCAGFFD